MESIRGKRAVRVGPDTLARQIAGYSHVLIDLGTGDGCFVRHVAETSPDTFAVGIDLCGANMREQSRRAPANALYLVASAYAPPPELHGVATHLTINFPWGDLLSGLLGRDARLTTSLDALCRPGARLEVRLNGGALTTAGWTLPEAGEVVRRTLRIAGFAAGAPRLLEGRDLRAFPSTWSHRLAFGRDPRALYLHAVKTGKGQSTVVTGTATPLSA